MASNINKEEARKELARRELARRQTQPTSSLGEGVSGATGISVRPGLAERTSGRTQKFLPETGQFIGGAVGSIAGQKVGAPVRGQIAGGTIGRAGGRILQNLLAGRPINAAESKKLGKEILQTAGSEAVFGIGGKLAKGAATGALESLIGKRVTERGIKEGFKRFLDPKFYQDRIPKEIVKKTSKFFDKIDNVLGKGVNKAVRGKTSRGSTIKWQEIKSQADKLLKESGAESIDDLGSPTISPAQRNKLREFMNVVNRVQQKNISPLSAWKIQKQMDKIRFRTNWDPDIRNYMDRVRGLTSSQIKRGSKEVSTAMGRYSSAQDMKKQLEGKFETTLIDGDTFSPKTEQFANTLLGTSKDETVRALRKLDSFLINADDKIVEDLLDVAATESLEKTINFMGVIQRSMIGAAGGQKGIARAAAITQTPGAKLLGGLIGRSAPTIFTSLQGEQQRQ